MSHHKGLRLLHVLDQTGFRLEFSKYRCLFIFQSLVQLFNVSFDFNQDSSEAQVADAHSFDLIGHLSVLDFIFLLFLGLKVASHHGRVYFVL